MVSPKTKKTASRTSGAKKPKKTLVEQACDQLRDQIVRLELAPGTKIEEQELSRQLGIGRTPIREALKMLVSEGLVVSYGSNSTYIKDVSLKSAKDLLTLIFHLGTPIFEMANPDGDFSEIIPELETIWGQMEQALAEEEITAFAELNASFHKTLARIGDNQYLETILERLYREEIRLAFMFSLAGMNKAMDSEYYGKLQAQHRRLIELLKKKDIAGMRETYREHLITGQQRMFLYFAKDFGPGISWSN